MRERILEGGRDSFPRNPISPRILLQSPIHISRTSVQQQTNERCLSSIQKSKFLIWNVTNGPRDPKPVWESPAGRRAEHGTIFCPGVSLVNITGATRRLLPRFDWWRNCCSCRTTAAVCCRTILWKMRFRFRHKMSHSSSGFWILPFKITIISIVSYYNKHTLSK